MNIMDKATQLGITFIEVGYDDRHNVGMFEHPLDDEYQSILGCN